jgi:hypothetical protein
MAEGFACVMAEGMFKMMDESIFCARMCIHQIKMKKKKKKKSPWKKGQVGSSFLWGRVAGAQVSNLAEIVQIWK